MDRRHFLAAALALPAMPAFAQLAKPAMRTQWSVRSSQALDAIAFLGPLSGRPLYRAAYAADADAFSAKLPDAIRNDIPRLWNEAEKSGFGLFWPVLASVVSGARADTLDQLIDASAAPRDTHPTGLPGQLLLGREGLGLVRGSGAPHARGVRRHARCRLRRLP